MSRSLRSAILGVGRVARRLEALRLITMMLLALGLYGCWTTFSAGTDAKPAAPYRTSGTLDDDLSTEVPTPQLFNFGFELQQSEPSDP